MVVHAVPGAGSAQIGPAPGNHEALATNLEVFEDALGGLVDAVDELSKPLQLVQPMARLPALPGHEIGERRPNLGKRPQDRLVDRMVDFGPEFRLPHEGGKHPQDVGVLRFLPWLPCHDARGHDARTSVWPKRPVRPGTFEPRTFLLSDSVGAGFAKSHPAAAPPPGGVPRHRNSGAGRQSARGGQSLSLARSSRTLAMSFWRWESRPSDVAAKSSMR